MKLTDKLLAIYHYSRLSEYYAYVIGITLFAFLYTFSEDLGAILIIISANILSQMFAFMINDLEDAEDDAQDPVKKLRNPVASGALTKKEALILAILVALGSLLLYSFFNIGTALVGLSIIVLGFMYSSKKVRLKSIPVLDSVSHALFLSSLIFLVSYFAFSDSYRLGIDTISVFGGFFLISVFGSLYNQVRDFEIDQKTKIDNSINRIGLSFAKLGMLAAFPASVIFIILGVLDKADWGVLLLSSFASLVVSGIIIALHILFFKRGNIFNTQFWLNWLARYFGVIGIVYFLVEVL